MTMKLLFTMFLALFCVGCASRTTLLPMRQDASSFKIPAQQYVLAEAVDSAVEGIELPDVAGSRVRITAIGLLEQEGTLVYVAETLASRLAAQGAIVTNIRAIRQETSGSETVVVLGPTVSEDSDVLDFAVALSQGGADREYYSGPLFFWGRLDLVGRCSIRITSYPQKPGENSFSSKYDGEATRTFRAWTFWLIPLSSSFNDPLI